MSKTRLVLGTLVSAALLAGGVACSDDPTSQEQIVATLSGANEVPARTSAGSGQFSAVVNGTSLVYTLRVSDLTNVTLAHIHTGVAGVNGGVIVDLFLGPPIATTGSNLILASGTITQAEIKTAGVTFQQLLDGLRIGGFYINVHTQTFPGGELRGQTSTITVTD